jgi:hypothetical protein
LAISKNQTAFSIDAIDIDDSDIETFVFDLMVDEYLSPGFKLLMFYVANGEIIPDSIEIPVEKCLMNKASLNIDRYLLHQMTKLTWSQTSRSSSSWMRTLSKQVSISE